ncbi:hypothetical protein [Streptomyces sp. ME18-1-4]|uniref:hypothetical protein n=1 Tax=Streptomyces sp. ME18-1-4 TaxID=3028685 RepID=UPI0029B0D5D0|nr:hypothetical protein [Streptomyces sp. ME18-1-4]MDX3244171.1 hypothetical protein [Streptomyces sp. ME18-1-4]
MSVAGAAPQEPGRPAGRHGVARPPRSPRRRGHLAAAVAWPADTLAGFGTALEPGRLLLSGTMTGAPFVDSGRHVEARSAASAACR